MGKVLGHCDAFALAFTASAARQSASGINFKIRFFLSLSNSHILANFASKCFTKLSTINWRLSFRFSCIFLQGIGILVNPPFCSFEVMIINAYGEAFTILDS